MVNSRTISLEYFIKLIQNKEYKITGKKSVIPGYILSKELDNDFYSCIHKIVKYQGFDVEADISVREYFKIDKKYVTFCHPNKQEARERYYSLINTKFVELDAENKSISLNQKYFDDDNAVYKLPDEIQLFELNTANMWFNVINHAVQKTMDCISSNENYTEFTYNDVYSYPEYGYALYELECVLDIVKRIIKKKGYNIHLGGMNSGSAVTIEKINVKQ